MTYRGRVKNGVIVLDDPTPLPEGTEVCVEPLPTPPPMTLADRFQNVIGQASDLPSDMAQQHDHYIHGVPKR